MDESACRTSTPRHLDNQHLTHNSHRHIDTHGHTWAHCVACRICRAIVWAVIQHAGADRCAAGASTFNSAVCQEVRRAVLARARAKGCKIEIESTVLVCCCGAKLRQQPPASRTRVELSLATGTPSLALPTLFVIAILQSHPTSPLCLTAGKVGRSSSDHLQSCPCHTVH
jgi:hypothetical protein